MMKPKKRLSGGMGLSADGIDPLFEFDVPRLFMDLTVPPRYVKAALSGGSESPLQQLFAHDPWFDHVHENHSRPTEDFLAQEQEQAKSRTSTGGGGMENHHHHHTSASLHRPIHSHTTHSHHQHPSDADGEKENLGGTGAARMKRRNVAYHLKGSATVATISSTIKTVTTTTTRSVSLASSSTGSKAAIAMGAAAIATAAGKKTPLSTAKLPFGNSSKAPSTSISTANAPAAAAPSARKRTVKEPSTTGSTTGSTATARSNNRRNATSSTTSNKAGKDLQDLQALLAKHNKKFKTTHTYEPRHHSVRDVRQWEKQTRKSYYKLSSEDRLTANEEIAQFVLERQDTQNTVAS